MKNKVKIIKKNLLFFIFLLVMIDCFLGVYFFGFLPSLFGISCYKSCMCFCFFSIDLSSDIHTPLSQVTQLV